MSEPTKLRSIPRRPKPVGGGPPIEHELDSLRQFKANAFLYLRRRLANIAAILAGDMVAITLGILIAGTVRMWVLGSFLIPPWAWLLPVCWIVGAYMAKLVPGWGEGAPEELRRSVTVLSGTYAVFVVALFLGKQADITSRFVFLTGYGATLFFLPLGRWAVRRVLMRRELWGVPTVIYDDTTNAPMVIEALRENPSFGYQPAAVIYTGDGEVPDEIEGVPVRPPVQQAIASAPVAIVIMPGIDRERSVEILDGLLTSYSEVLIVPDLISFPSLWVRALDMGQGLLVLQVTRNQLSPLAGFGKRAIDLVAVIATSPLWVPLVAAISVAIWFSDRRSPFFVQERLGRGGRPFRTLKFRTMVPDAEGVLGAALDADEALREEWDRSFKLRSDPRITRLGTLLRRTSLDELPQLWNVLRGEMSLVGPRPLPEYHHRELSGQVRKLREGVRPGMTGLWQVSGRSESGNEGFERWDAYYVRNWSIWLDAFILWRTARALLAGRGAY